MARSIEKVIEETIRQMDEERFLDWDEQDTDEEYDDEWDEEPVSVDEFYSMKLSRADMGW